MLPDANAEILPISGGAADKLTEAVKAVNDAIRQAHEAGLKVNAAFLNVRHDGAFMPQITFATQAREPASGADGAP